MSKGLLRPCFLEGDIVRNLGRHRFEKLASLASKLVRPRLLYIMMVYQLINLHCEGALILKNDGAVAYPVAHGRQVPKGSSPRLYNRKD